MTVRSLLHRTDPYAGFEPLPGHVQGWGSDHPIFVEMIRQTNPSAIVEVGTWLGASALHMAGLCGAEIVCVDTWLGSKEMWDNFGDSRHDQLQLRHGYPQLYYQFLSNVVHAGKQGQITPCPLPSLIAARLLLEKGARFDLCYIDASHDEEDVLADIAAWLPLLRPGGVLFGDDLDWPSVDAAITRCPHHVERMGRYWKIAAPPGCF